MSTGSSFPNAVTLDSTYVYRTDYASAVDDAGSVVKAPLDGGAPVTLVSGINQPLWPAVVGERLYFNVYQQLMTLSPK